MMDTNYLGAIRVIKGALPRFREKQNGAIVNISSGAALLGVPGVGCYAASKAALEGI